MKAYFMDIVKGEKPSLIVFLRAAEPDAEEVRNLVEEIKVKYGDRLAVQDVDSSYDHKIATDFRITRYPTYILFKEGEELMRESGKKSVTEISEMVDRAF